MKSRCPSAEFRYRAVLENYRLAFTRRSATTGTGVADVEPSSSREVWGVVYRIPEGEVSELDRAEGYQEGRIVNAYERRWVEVIEDGQTDQERRVQAYFAIRQNDPPLPSSEYLGYLVNGARHWALPGRYIAMLEGTRTAD